jgi:peptidoglycan/xylan/chitin deacetylase (PgdA/CDA1 family)
MCQQQPVRSAGLRAAAWRGRDLVLLYHRVSGRPSSVVPTITPERMARQLEALAGVMTFVAAEELSRAPEAAAPRIAVTFDDDDRAHVDTALPVLQRLNLRATFFVSGRALHGLAHNWWVLLEEAIAAHGAAEVGRRLGIAGGPQELARACEEPDVAARLYAMAPNSTIAPLSAGDIRSLAEAGMTIGFHTLHHPVLPSLADAVLETALTDGRDRLEQAAGSPVTTLSYPHGRTDRRVARAAERSGYRAAFATGGRAVSRTVDRFRIPRWEPGPLDARGVVAEAIVRLHGPAP